MPPLVHWTSSTTSKLACATSCMTCLPPVPFLCPYPTLDLPAAALDGGCAPKMENELDWDAVGTDMTVDDDDLVEVRYASYSGLSSVPISTAGLVRELECWQRWGSEAYRGSTTWLVLETRAQGEV